MKPNEFLAVLERFFLDIIGTVIPGAIFLISGWIILGRPMISGSALLIPPKSVFGWISVIVAGYIVGYGIISIGERVLLPFIEYMQKKKKKKKKKKKWIGKLFHCLGNYKFRHS